MSLTKSIIEELKSKWGCHTVVLYGSRAREDHTGSSDYDVVGVRKQGERARDARELDEGFLDAFIYSEKDLEALEPAMIRLRDGLVLWEQADYGTRLIARANTLFNDGPAPLPAGEARLLRTWCRKTLIRISRGDPVEAETNYRRVWLLYELLEIYFKLRQKWYLGPNESLAWLRTEDPRTFGAFEAALMPDATRSQLRALTELILSPGQSS